LQGATYRDVKIRRKVIALLPVSQLGEGIFLGSDRDKKVRVVFAKKCMSLFI